MKHTIDVPSTVYARLADGIQTCYQGVARDSSLVPQSGDVVEFVEQTGWWGPGSEDRDRLYFRVGRVELNVIGDGPAVHWTGSVTFYNPLAA